MPILFADRAMIVFMWALVATPVISLLVAPNGWRYAVALENQMSGNLDTAEKQFKELTLSDSGDVAAWYRLSEIAVEQKRYSEALQYVNRALWYRLSEVALERNDFQESLRCIDRALTGSEQFVDLPIGDQTAMKIGDQKATILLAMGEGQKAISLVKRFVQPRQANADLSEIPQGMLNDLMAETRFQVYFNMLAYFIAVADIELKNAARYIDSVLLGFHQIHGEGRFVLPYLYELNGDYEKAQNAYAEILSETLSALPPLDGLSAFLTQKCGIAQPEDDIRPEMQMIPFSGRYKVLHRMKLIAKKLSQNEYEEQIDQLIQKLSEEEKQDFGLKLIVDREKILEQASSLRSYLDTRAFINYRQAQKFEKGLIRGIDQLDLTNLEKAKSLAVESINARLLEVDSLNSKSLADIERAMEIHKAIEKFNEIQPPNSLVVRRSTDENVAARQDKKNSAVLYYHYALILQSNERFEEAATAIRRISELGFEIDEMLF